MLGSREYSRTNNITSAYLDSIGDRVEAHRIAHDIRKFEIELYWKRNVYFWGFQVSFFAAYGFATTLTASSAVDVQMLGYSVLRISQSPSNSVFFFHSSLLSIIPLFAAVFSLLWLRMIDGAKAWQDNWERHIDMLEDHVVGPLYKTYFFDYKIGPPGSGPYSVTKVNRRLVTVLTFFWVFITVSSALYAFSSGMQGGYFAFSSIRDIQPYLLAFLTVAIMMLIVLLSGLRMSYAGEKIATSCESLGAEEVSHHLYRRRALKRNQTIVERK